jgi:hypothetical protein
VCKYIYAFRRIYIYIYIYIGVYIYIHTCMHVWQQVCRSRGAVSKCSKVLYTRYRSLLSIKRDLYKYQSIKRDLYKYQKANAQKYFIPDIGLFWYLYRSLLILVHTI